MSILTEAIAKTITISGGSGAHTFQSFKNRRLQHLFIKPTNNTTEYSVIITDADSIQIYRATGLKKTKKITNSLELPSFVYGNFTLTITADNDEDFTVKPVITETIGPS